MIQFLVAIFSMLASCTVTAGPVLNKSRAVIINGPIDGPEILALSVPMQEYAKKSNEPIDIVINSPGGSVVLGFLFISHMEELRAAGIKFRCFVPYMAASMAFHIYLHCDERYALNHSFLLWHRVRVYLGGGMFSSGVALTSPLAQTLADDLAAMDAHILTDLRRELKLPDAVLLKHFEAETLHIASQLKTLTPQFLSTELAIPGLLESLRDPKIPNVGQGSLEREFQAGEIVYITNKAP